MCSVSLFTFPPGRRLLIDSWSRSHLFGKFFVSDALSLPCECACVRVCARDALSLLRVCVCVCVADALSLPTLTGLCRPEIWTTPVLVRAALSTAWAQTVSRSAPVFLRLYKTGFLFRVSVFSSALKHWARVCPLSIRRFQRFHVNVNVAGKNAGKKRLINSYPFELSRGTWSQLDAAAFTGSHRRVWCPQKTTTTAATAVILSEHVSRSDLACSS